jgi:hypothetical protein
MTSSSFGGDGGHEVHHEGTELKSVGDALRERACSTDSPLGAPRVARWDSERSADHKHYADRGVLVTRRLLAITCRPTGRRAPSTEILSVRLPLASALFLRGNSGSRALLRNASAGHARHLAAPSSINYPVEKPLLGVPCLKQPAHRAITECDIPFVAMPRANGPTGHPPPGFSPLFPPRAR